MRLRSTCWWRCIRADELADVLAALGETGADAIGVNNRDLKTFDVSQDISLALVDRIPSNVVRVTESGISTPEDIAASAQGGIRCVPDRREPDAPARSRRGAGGIAQGRGRKSMSLWIKICANTSLGDAQLAADAGADAVGFVFAPSPRRVTAEQAAKIVAQLPAALEKIGIFVDAGFGEIAATVEAAGLTGVQLHFDAPAALPAQLRERFGPGLRILGVVHFDARAGKHVAAITRDEHIDALLVDSRTAAAVGGTGVAFDWDAASKTIFQDTGARMVAAGGLTPENVADAIATLRPWGVDVVSGVEAAPGRKDPAKVRAFVANARAANTSAV